jgi:hypothetical protein
LIPVAASLAACIILAVGVFLAASKAAFSAASYSFLTLAASSLSSSATLASYSFYASSNYFFFLSDASCFSCANFSPAVACSIIAPKIPLL